MTASTNYFTDLVTTEHQDKPNYIKTVSLSVQGFADQIALCAQSYNLYDLDKAYGSQLDAIGLWVGISRFVSLDIQTYFSWDTLGVGWDQGKWWRVGDAESVVTQLSDQSFRDIIRLKIMCNKSDGSIPSATEIVKKAVEGAGATVSVAEGIMEVTFNIKGDISRITRAILLGGYLPIKASGVGVNYTFVDSVVINDDFGGDIA